jgi:hypothetical protein
VAVGNVDRLLFVGLYRFSSQSDRRTRNPQAQDGPALALRGFPDVLALEITIVRRSAKGARGRSPAHSDDRCKILGKQKAATVARLEDLPSQSY